jgi:hypothetical protein
MHDLWEYTSIRFETYPTIKETVDELNLMGKDGWELCVVEGGPALPIVLILKRKDVTAESVAGKALLEIEDHLYDADMNTPEKLATIREVVRGVLHG